MDGPPPTFEDIRQAAERLSPHISRTPTVPSFEVSERLGAQTWLKLDLLQPTGAFKVRGAFNKLLKLGASARRPGVVAVSGGNHGLAVAHAAQALGVDAVVVMPVTTPANYVEGVRRRQAHLVLVPTIGDAFREGLRQAEAGRVMLHPFDDRDVVAGQGTLALEMLEQAPNLTDLLVSVGGGGLLAGTLVAAEALRPGLRVWAVETRGADSLAQALAAGRPVRLAAITSIARTLGAPEVPAWVLELAKRRLAGHEVVTDAAAVAALRFLLERAKLLTEPSASCVLAAAERLRPRLPPDARVGLVLCGGNASLEDVNAWSERLLPEA